MQRIVSNNLSMSFWKSRRTTRETIALIVAMPSRIECLDADMSYHIDRGNFFGGTIRTRQTYGTRFMDAISIIEELLNSRIVTIRDRVQEGEKVRYVI